MMRCRHFLLDNVPLAQVSKDKREEDEHSSRGIFSFFQYFNDEERDDVEVIINEKGQWIFKKTRTPVELNHKYMYVVRHEGYGLYLFNSSVHSQLNAGNPVLSAGWVEYSGTSAVFDNCSGHYTPSLSMFMVTLLHLWQSQFFSETLQIRLHKLTIIDSTCPHVRSFLTNIFSSARDTDEGVLFNIALTDKSIELQGVNEGDKISLPISSLIGVSTIDELNEIELHSALGARITDLASSSTPSASFAAWSDAPISSTLQESSTRCANLGGAPAADSSEVIGEAVASLSSSSLLNSLRSPSFFSARSTSFASAKVSAESSPNAKAPTHW